MPLSVGSRLGAFEILAPIGAGGMGEVYRAHDTKLKRDVALKVLPETFACDPERMARFEREAEVLASLNHPNIAAIYGVEGTALVMEFIDGDSPKGPLPFEEAWHIGSQIAGALEYAHGKGIVHRDLKPANVKITSDGMVKLLDFGLAKAFTVNSEARISNGENSPTLTIGATEAGLILGTAAYMAPEQAKGKRVDKRADIWAFGVLLHEMLTGQRLFQGENTAETLAAVIDKQPDLGTAPIQARRLLEHCLVKDPRKRLRDIGDAAALLNISPDPSSQPPSNSVPLLLRIASLACAAAIVVLAAGWWRSAHPDNPPKPLLRLELALAGTDTILSPDGTRLVYVSQNRLFTQRLDEPNARELAGTGGAFAPFFSPDGQWIGFFGQSALRKISVDGGAVMSLVNTAPNARGASWSEDGTIIASGWPTGGLMRFVPAGQRPERVTQLAPGEATHRWPQILPGGKAVLFTANSATTGFDEANIEVVTLSDRRQKTLVRGGTFGRYLPSGHLVYVSRGTLFAVPFNVDRLEVEGTPTSVLEHVAYAPANGSAQFASSSVPGGPGAGVYRSGGPLADELFTVNWLDSSGNVKPLLAKSGGYIFPSLSPDGQRLAIMIDGDIWIYEWRRDVMTRLSFDGARSPVWTPDGRAIIFGTRGQRLGLMWTRSDGAGRPQALTQSEHQQTPFSVSADGKVLAFQELNNPNGMDLWTLPLEADAAGLRAGKPVSFLQTPSNELEPAFSPDGRWLAYSSDESGTHQVYVRSFPDKGERWQISSTGGVYPVFSRDGHQLFFRTEDSRTIMAVSCTMHGDSFESTRPRVWSETLLANVGLVGRNFDVAPDGIRMIAVMPAQRAEEPNEQNHLVLLLNLFDELRRRVPTRK
jgi:serine/threonine protein kinase/Tol biopolymer transport system component